MDLLESLHQRLLLSIASSGIPADEPITVGDLYQRLIPYRAIRGELRILELAEYEHALLRLLAGERRFAQAEPNSVRLEIQRELASPNPLLGIYMDYPEAKVVVRRIAPAEAGNTEGSWPPTSMDASSGREHDQVHAAEAPVAPSVSRQGSSELTVAAAMHANSHLAAGPQPDAGEPRPSQEVAYTRRPPATGAESGTDEPLPLIDPGDDPHAARVEGARAEATLPRPSERGQLWSSGADAASDSAPPPYPSHCRACSATLPAAVDARFCPTCGYQQSPCVCGRCGSRCEPGWSFCAGCGFDLR